MTNRSSFTIHRQLRNSRKIIRREWIWRIGLVNSKMILCQYYFELKFLIKEARRKTSVLDASLVKLSGIRLGE